MEPVDLVTERGNWVVSRASECGYWVTKRGYMGGGFTLLPHNEIFLLLLSLQPHYYFLFYFCQCIFIHRILGGFLKCPKETHRIDHGLACIVPSGLTQFLI